MDYVVCTDCGKQFEAAQMTTFQKYEVFSYDSLCGGSLHNYWEEAIPGKKRKSSLSDKLPDMKVFCPSCADRFRFETKQKGRTRRILGIIFLIIVGIIIFVYLIL
jgi:hypothetical protein